MEEGASHQPVPPDNALGGPRPVLGAWWPAQGSQARRDAMGGHSNSEQEATPREQQGNQEIQREQAVKTG